MKVEVELEPMCVPNFVIQKTPAGKRQDGFKESPKHALADIGEDALSMLCDEFRSNVFKKAEKRDPRLV